MPKNLKFIKLTNDWGISLLIGQIIPNSKISNNNINEIKELFNQVLEIPNLKNIYGLNKINIEDITSYKPS